MNKSGITTTAVVFLLLGISAPASSQQERHEQNQKDRPSQRQESHSKDSNPAPPAKRQAQQADRRSHETKQAEAHKPAQQRAHHEQSAKSNGHDEHRAQSSNRHAEQRHSVQSRRVQERQRVQHSAWEQHRSQHWESDHRTWQQRGGYRGYRIPNARFRGYFGPDHGFRIHGLPFLVVGGFPRFQYRGYWLSTVDPWPEAWGPTWYDTDDVYVNYVDNGYYLFNRRYPTAGIAISVSM
jgi:hypothetical protein